MRRWSECLRSCIPCCPSCNKEEPLMNSDIQQASGHIVEELVNDSHEASHSEAPLIDTQVRQFTLKEQQLPPLSLDDLNALLDLVTAQVESLAPSGSTPDATMLLMRNAVSQYAEHKEVVTSFIQSLPSEFKKKVVGGGKDVVMPLLSNALGGLGNLQWVGLGLRLIGWCLDNMHTIVENSDACLEILRDAVDLMKKTKKIWVQPSRDHEDTTNPDLQKTIQIAFRCAIICITNMNNHDILRFIDAQRVKGAIAELKQELRDAKFNNLYFMVEDRYVDGSKVDRQVSFADDCYNDRVGGDEGTHESMEYLIKDCNDMIGVCLHGMGGIGKSFIGLEIYKKFQKSRRLQQGSPYKDCRVELELGIKDEKLVDIQKQILHKICGVEASKIFDCVEGREKLAKEIKKINDPIFLYLDNVLESQHLEEILPKASCFPKGSKLLVTSRGANIETGIRNLGIQDYKLIEIKKMQDKQAKELLWKQINNEEKHIEVSNSGALEELEDKVLKLCGGLPLALKVVGGYIGSAKKGPTHSKVWQDVVNAMEKAEPISGEAHDKLYSRINFSIETLYPNIRRAFLDIVSYYEIGTEWKSIKRLVDHNHLKILHQRALVQKTVKSSSQPSLIEIHDVINALARRMINDDTHELRITGMDNLERHNVILEKVVALKGVSLKACMLKQMPLLRFLKDVYVEGEGEEAQLRHLSVLHDLRSRTGKLFNLDECVGLKEVVWSRAIENAADLELLRHKKISKELEVLDLYSWKQLKNVDAIETLTSLKELALNYCIEISYLPEGIGSLRKLEKLDLEGCRSLQSLPNGATSLIGLTTLHLDQCSSLQMLPEGIGSLTRLTSLSMFVCTAIQCLPEGISGLKSLTKLRLGCSSLQCLPEGVGGLKRLTNLNMWSCSSLRSLPKGFGSMTSLEELSLCECSSLQSLPEELASLTCLAKLKLSRCDNVGLLMQQPVLQMLTSLSQLDLSYCKTLKSIEAVTTLTRLTEINLKGCESLQMLPEGFSRLTRLTKINLDGCESLQMLPEGFSRLTRLTSLDLGGTSLNSLQDIKSFTGLKSLALSNCEGLYSLMEEGTFSMLGMLTEVEVSWCRCLQYLPQSITSLTSLEHLSLEGYGSLQFLPDELTSLTGLKELKLTEWESVQSLPQGITSLMRLRWFEWLECRSLKALPRAHGGAQYWTSLKWLKLQGCSSLQSLQEIAGLAGLRVLRLEGCASLDHSMLEEIWKLTGLEYLVLSKWDNIRALPDGLATMTRLGRLDLRGCTSLLCVPEEVTRLTNLTRLDLSGCKSLKCLPQGLSSLAHLRLKLDDCTSLVKEDTNLITDGYGWCDASRLCDYPSLFQTHS